MDSSLIILIPLIIVILGIGLYFFKKSSKDKVLASNDESINKVLEFNKKKDEIQADLTKEEEKRKELNDKINEEKGKTLNDKELSDFFNDRNGKS